MWPSQGMLTLLLELHWARSQLVVVECGLFQLDWTLLSGVVPSILCL
jgi:hypothetical protein